MARPGPASRPPSTPGSLSAALWFFNVIFFYCGKVYINYDLPF